MATPSANAPALPPRESKPAAQFAFALGVLVVVIGGLAMFRWFDPAQHRFFPRCTFHSLTGLECPGCGGQRAVHHLLHGEINAAFHANALLLVLIPIGTWLLLRFILRRYVGRTLPALFLNRTWLWLLIAALVTFGIVRNLPGFEWLRP